MQITICEPREKVEKHVQMQVTSKGKAMLGEPSGSREADADNMSGSDSGYLPGDNFSSEENEEAKEILKNFMQFK